MKFRFCMKKIMLVLLVITGEAKWNVICFGVVVVKRPNEKCKQTRARYRDKHVGAIMQAFIEQVLGIWNVFTGLIFNVSQGLICVFITFTFYCRFRLVSPRSYIVILTPILNKFQKQTSKHTRVKSTQQLIKIKNF